ncbi:aldehyde dehydrogenase family protein [Streptomyces sp. DSM 3412]|uniref:Aldehyde dehydrogenase family protein n=1 Tax=Streptomyces gottesmaniae TaxID=3075518 RepID=A0ABU2ZC13_9ACTN|nr:aldehyde dehydrogenase family protein [Streptomyces sp. DSM 3412]MDT0574134.1 aldehyde dehydrogenase family protein [Streptomyces sp. DSM 3412]
MCPAVGEGSNLGPDHVLLGEDGPIRDLGDGSLPYDDEDEAVARSNDTEYGLAAAVRTRDVATAHRVAGNIRAGTVFVNMPNPVDASAPWGGFGASGWGREMGSGALDLYTEVKSVWTSLA